MTLSGKQTAWLFAALAATVYTVVFFMSRTALAMTHPGRIGLAAFCDLTITVPFLYYLLMVRSGRSSWMAAMAMLFAGARAATVLLPAAQQSYLPGVRWLGVPFELWVVTAVVRRVRRMDSGDDAIARIHAAVRAVLRNEWLAEFVAAEIEVFYYALFAWRAKPQTRAGYRAFTCGEASGYLTLSIFVAVVLVFEGVPMHLLLHRWSGVTAWVGTGLDLYALLWVVALVRSLRLRPMLVGERSVVLQIGIVWRTEIPRDNIKACRRIVGEAPRRKEPGYLSLVVMNEPRWLIELHEPAAAHGLYGRRRMVTRIGVAVDDAEGFGGTV